MKGVGSILKACLGRVNRYTVERRVQVVLPWVNGDVLDIGCGSGYLAHIVSEGQRYVGVDIGEEKIRLLKHQYMNHPRYEFWCIDVDRETASGLPFSDSAFDTISLLAVIEHLQNPSSLLRLLHRLLKSEGHLLITTPTSVGDRISRLISTTISGMKDPLSPHVRIYDRTSLTTLAEEGGFSALRYMRFELGMNQLLVCSSKPGH